MSEPIPFPGKLAEDGSYEVEAQIVPSPQHVTVLADDERETAGFQLIICLDGAPSPSFEPLKADLLWHHEIEPILAGSGRRPDSDVQISRHHALSMDGRFLVITYCFTALAPALATVAGVFADAELPLSPMHASESFERSTDISWPGELRTVDQLSPREKLFLALRNLLGFEQAPVPWWDQRITADLVFKHAPELVAKMEAEAEAARPHLILPSDLDYRRN